MKRSKSDKEDPVVMSEQILKFLSVYTMAGIASRNRFSDAPPEYHPRNLMPDFKSIIAFAQAPKVGAQPIEMGSFHNLFNCIAAQDAAIQYLKGKGFVVDLISPTTKSVSLSRIGEQAGIGEISGVNSLLVEGCGLGTSLGAIITSASLKPSKILNNICTECGACVDVCPATDEFQHLNSSKCITCGECVKICPA